MNESADLLAADEIPRGGPDAGALLRAGREAAGLSVAAVAQQLKLAPRQIAALEDGDFANLPGRTFIRGFVRNYARLLHLDSDTVLAALPETAPPSSLGYPSLAPTPRPMGELPAEVNNKPSLARWAIPLALVAVVTVAAIYEMTRPPTDQARTAAVDKPLPASTQVVPADAPATPPANMVTALPNPLAASDDRTGVAPDSASAAPTAEVATAQGADAGEALIALSFRARSWVEVRDAAGVLILSITGNAGDSQAVNGRPPFEVVLGNAAAVSVSWQGKAFDTAPYTRQNVARFTLR